MSDKLREALRGLAEKMGSECEQFDEPAASFVRGYKNELQAALSDPTPAEQAKAEPVAWLHDVVQNDGKGEENDQALSFKPDNFPLEGDAPYLWRSLCHRPLYLAPWPDIDTLVNRFLGWKLPDSFSPDCFVKFDAESAKRNHSWPVGTNLFTANQAKEMFEYALQAKDAPQPASAEVPGWAWREAICDAWPNGDIRCEVDLIERRAKELAAAREGRDK